MAPEQIAVPRDQLQTFIEAVTTMNGSSQEAGEGQAALDYGSIKHAVALGLRFIDRTKPYGTELFDALCWLTVTVAIEAVCIRRNPATRKIEVLLTQRSATDTAYPGEFHAPGSAKRPLESDNAVLKRLEAKEFFGQIARAEYVDKVDTPNEARGHFLSLVYCCEAESGTKGTWYPVDQLPANTVHSHRHSFIPMAVTAFEKKEVEAEVKAALMPALKRLTSRDLPDHALRIRRLGEYFAKFMAEYALVHG